MVEQGATDADVVDYIKDNFRLVLFTPEERRLLDRVNRSRIVEDSLKGAGIELYKG
jgi:hypothetical protein